MRIFRYLIVTAYVLALTINTLSSKEISWYKNFKGKVGSYPAEIHICKFKDEIRGYFYYDKFKQPLIILGNLVGDSLKLMAYSNNFDSENFDGILKSGKYSGEWTKWKEAAKTGQFSFEFQEDISKLELFEFVYVSGHVDLFKMWDKSPTADYLEGTIWPTEQYMDYSVVRKEICTEKNMPTGLNAIGVELLERKDKFLKDYFKTNEGITKKEIEKYGYTSTFNQEEQGITVITYYDKNIFVISTGWYSYTGGAHGIYGTGYRIIDLVNKKMIGLKDIINDEGLNALPDLLVKNFRKQFGVKDDQTLSDFGLSSDSIHVTENVCLTPGCLMFSYTPYEIGSYAMGEMVIYIPINEIDSYLKPEIKKLINN